MTVEEREPEDMGGEYGFRAGLATEWDYDDGEMFLRSLYVVELPHQCDAWGITRCMFKAEAIAEMEKFIAEANAALEKLRQAGAAQPPSGFSLGSDPEDATSVAPSEASQE